MKILVVGLSPAYALNSAAMRTNALVKGLLELGNEVDYLTKSFSGQASEIANLDWPEGVRICFTGEFEQYRTLKSDENNSSVYIFLKNIFHLFFIYDHTYFIARKIDVKVLPQKEYDLIISSSDPKTSHLCVERLFKQGIICDKWVQYWGDPLASDITKKTIYPRWLVKFLERRILKKADKVVYVSPFTCELQKNIFPRQSQKMHWIPIPYWDEKITQYDKKNNFTIGYFGDYQSRVRNILPFYNVCKMLHSNIITYIIGDSDLCLKEDKNIKVLSRREISSYENEVNLLICILNKTGTQIPGKLYHYAATDKPILVIIDGREKDKIIDYINKFNRFYICENKEAEIKKKLNEIMKSNKKFYPCQQLSSFYIADRFLNILKD